MEGFQAICTRAKVNIEVIVAVTSIKDSQQEEVSSIAVINMVIVSIVTIMVCSGHFHCHQALNHSFYCFLPNYYH